MTEAPFALFNKELPNLLLEKMVIRDFYGESVSSTYLTWQQFDGPDTGFSESVNSFFRLSLDKKPVSGHSCIK